jgi:glycosyltransferase involved in cell wall biosynthesis
MQAGGQADHFLDRSLGQPLVTRQLRDRKTQIVATPTASARKNIAFLEVVLRRWRARGETPPPRVVTGVPRPRVHGGRSHAPSAGIVRIGHVSDRELHGLYTAASAFCFPSLAEGFGRPPLEAVACGTPAVVARFAGAAERFGAIARVLPLDADAWVDALRELVSGDSGDRSSGGPAAGSADLAKAHSWDDAATRVLHACRIALDIGTGEAAVR